MTARDPWAFRDNFRRCTPWDLQAGLVVGGDIPLSVEVTEDEASRGTDKLVGYLRAVYCPRCSGTGGEPGTLLELCSRCNGKGAASRSQKPGSKAKKSLCTFCTGRGKIPTIPCPRCKGRAVLYEEHVETVPIPAGTEDDIILKVPGAGHQPSPDLKPGNLLLSVIVLFKEFQLSGPSRMDENPPAINEESILANLSAMKSMDFEEIRTNMGVIHHAESMWLDVKLRMLELSGKVLVEIQLGTVMYRKC